jgi:phenylacetate-CoA ligase
LTGPGDGATLTRDLVAMRHHQRDALRRLLTEVLAANPFYRAKLGGLGLDPARFELEDLPRLPHTAKAELVADQERSPPFGTNLTHPLDRYVRLHLTSGTSGAPLRWLDTSESWSAFLDSWTLVLRAIGLSPADRVLVAFSFGPFIGFWGAFEAAQRIGALTLTGGALTSEQRLEHLLDHGVTVLVCTPTYALRLAEVARRHGVDLRRSAVRATLHAGEPGASVPAVKARLEEAWGAPCFDHAGATELGAWGYPGPDLRMFVDEERFLPELIDPESGALLTPGPDGARGELVLTSLARLGSPLLRYRTGDLVHLVPGTASDPRTFLQGGVLGRVDDMFVVRGVNVYPSAVENVVRAVPGIEEFQATVARRDGMAELSLEIETAGGAGEDPARALVHALRERFHLRVDVRVVEPGSLPRYELKAKRFRFA